MDESEEEIALHNDRELWRDAENHLRIARESVEHALCALDDLQAFAVAEQIEPLVPALRTWQEYAMGQESA